MLLHKSAKRQPFPLRDFTKSNFALALAILVWFLIYIGYSGQYLIQVNIWYPELYHYWLSKDDSSAHG